MRTAFLSLLTIVCLMLAVVPAMADTLYDNGPYNGTAYAWTINFGYAVSDSFTVGANSTIENLDFVYWDASSTDVLTTVDLAVGTTSFGGTPQTTGVTNTSLGTNQFGYNLYLADAALGAIYWTGAGFVTLQNACSTSGCSISNPIYWDENSGPSTAYENTLGSIPSEAFTLTGSTCVPCGCWIHGPDCGPPTPEPSSILLFGSGILGLVGVLRRKVSR